MFNLKNQTITLGLKEFLFISILTLVLIFSKIHSDVFYFIFGLIFILFFSYIYGHWLSLKSNFLIKFVLGLIIVITITSLVGTISFYTAKITIITFYLQIIIVSLLPIVYFINNKIEIKINTQSQFNKQQLANYLINIFLTASYLFLTAYLFYLIINSGTEASLRSPWEIIPKNFFFLYFLATFILIIKILTKPQKTLPLIIIQFFLSFSIAFFVYQIGINYDPFIHRQNELLISQTGTLLPKPFYYIGNYSLIIFLHKLLHLPLFLLNRLILPLLAALAIPTTLVLAFKENYKIDKKYLYLLPLAFLILPFSNFISTTPQGMANLFSIIIIFLSLYYLHKNNKNILLLFFLALITISIHPLTGLPILFFLILLWFYLRFQKKMFMPGFLTKSIFFEIVIFFILSLPSAFLINSYTSSQMKVLINVNFVSYFLDSLKNFNLELYYRPFISIYDLVYTYANNLHFIIGLLTLYGIIFIIIHKKFKKYFIYLLTFVILVINYLFIKSFFLFNSLISYERNNYTLRILELSLFFLLPFFLIAFYQIFYKLINQKKILRLLISLLLSLTITVSLYLSYPRVDPISEDHGYSTSGTDIKTVNFLENINKDQDYIVLAAQSVSAAAIQELGFISYYNDQFFYPVPTGGELYQYYEELAYNKRDTIETLNDVTSLTGVKLIYLVINDYWWAAEDIIAKQKNLADDWFSIDGKNFIFKYELP